MKRGIEEVKEMSPMFPRLHVKDADKGGPKAPPRNKMALYEHFTIPSQSFASGSPSKFPPLLRTNCSVPPRSGLMIIESGIFSAFKVEENVAQSWRLVAVKASNTATPVYLLIWPRRFMRIIPEVLT